MTPSLPSTPKAPWVVDQWTYSNPRKKLTTMALGLGDGVFLFCPADPDPAAFFFTVLFLPFCLYALFRCRNPGKESEGVL